MSFYPEEFYNIHDDGIDELQHYTYQLPSHSGTVSQNADEKLTVDDADLSWGAIGTSAQDPYRSSQSMAWGPETHALGFDTLQTPTQAMFGNPSSSFTTPDLSIGWAVQQTTSAPESLQNRTQSDRFEPVYRPSSSLTDCNQWRPFHHASYFSTPNLETAADHTSPARSDHSESSYSSLIISSPYAQSDGYFQTCSPRGVKLEDSLKHDTAQLFSIPRTTANERRSHIDPHDIITRAKPSPAQRSRSSSCLADTRSAKEEQQDAKSALDASHMGVQDAGAADMLRDGDGDVEPKRRSYTTAANCTCRCSECGKLFQRVYNLRAHMNTHNPERAQPHACRYSGCDRRFVRRTDLIRHEQSVHLKVRNFACPMCKNTFSRKDTMTRHIDDGCSLRPESRSRLERRRSSLANAATSRRGANHAYMGKLPLIKTKRP